MGLEVECNFENDWAVANFIPEMRGFSDFGILIQGFWNFFWPWDFFWGTEIFLHQRILIRILEIFQIRGFFPELEIFFRFRDYSKELEFFRSADFYPGNRRSFKTLDFLSRIFEFIHIWGFLFREEMIFPELYFLILGLGIFFKRNVKNDSYTFTRKIR